MAAPQPQQPTINLTGAVVAVNESSLVTFGNGAITVSTTPRFMSPGYDDAMAQTTTLQYRAPRAGTFRSLRVVHNTPAGNGNDIVYTLRVNSVATVLSATLASTDADGSDLVNSAVVAAGDLIDLFITKALAIGASPTNITATMEFGSA